MANLRADNLTGTGGRNAIDGSVYFNERYTRLELDGSSDLAFGTGDFTIEMWIKIDNGTNTNTIYDARPSGSNGAQVALFYSGSSNGILFAHGGTVRITGTVDVGADQAWHHIALTRASGSTKLFVDGVQDGSTYSSDTTDYLNPSNKPRIGASGGSTDLSSDGYFRGYISNVRVNKGSALYTAAFTPPTEKLTAVENTVLLCCQDSDDATQEATGKTITGYGRYFASTGELFANTGFSADSDWDKGTGWTISGGLATHAQGSAGDLAQQISGLVVGQTYKLSVDIISTDNDVAYFFVDNNPGGNYPPLTGADSSPVGYHFIYFDANATTMWLGFRGSSLWAGTLTNLRLSSADRGKSPNVLPPVGVDEGVVFDGDMKVNSPGVMYFPTGDTSQRGRGRGIFAGGYRHNAIYYKSIDYINIQSSGNFIDFGDLTQAVHNDGGCCSSSTRGIVGGGYVASPVGSVNNIEYVTIATTSNSTDFGDLLAKRFAIGGPAGNETRGLFMGGSEPTTVDTIEYVTIASTGNSTDFGNLTGARKYLSSTSNSTRAVAGGGRNNASPDVSSNVVDYVTIATTGNAADFGDLSKNGDQFSASSSTTRAVFGNRYSNSPTPAYDATFDYITLASTGNATDFGDASGSNGADSSSVSNSTRGVWAGGAQHPAYYNSIYYITIATTGNTIEFGDQNHTGASGQSSFSDSHGGLS